MLQLHESIPQVELAARSAEHLEPFEKMEEARERISGLFYFWPEWIKRRSDHWPALVTELPEQICPSVLRLGQGSYLSCLRAAGKANLAVDERRVGKPSAFPPPDTVRYLVLQRHGGLFAIGQEADLQPWLKVTGVAGELVRQVDQLVDTERNRPGAPGANPGKARYAKPPHPLPIGEIPAPDERKRNPRIVRRDPDEERNRPPASDQPRQRARNALRRTAIFELDSGRRRLVSP